jgi:hypothetical protein
MCRNNNASEWEETITLGLRSIFSYPFEKTKTGGTTEKYQ